MARILDKQKAIKLRLRGKSYSEIKTTLGISKSTLSNWLADYPLPPDKIRELRDLNPRRIEHFRETMRKKKDDRLAAIYEKSAEKIGKITDREMFVAGLLLYWAEGSKTKLCVTALTNTNPAMLRFFIRWLKFLGVDKSKLKFSLHLYSDMNISKSIRYWSDQLGVSESQFRKPYIKKTLSTDITYKNGFGKGTCSAIYDNRDVGEFVAMSMKYLSNRY